jgi:hypothetical protein
MIACSRRVLTRAHLIFEKKQNRVRNDQQAWPTGAVLDHYRLGEKKRPFPRAARMNDLRPFP